MLARARVIPQSAWTILQTIFSHRKVLPAIVRSELEKRYSGSLLGSIWVLLYPILFLAVYLFLYLVIFRMRFPGFSRMDYVVYVFCGLIPYLGCFEALTAGATVLKSNVYVVRSLILPLELIPIRSVLVSLVSQVVSLGVLLVLATSTQGLTPHCLWLPVIFLMQVLLLMGLVFFCACAGLVLPDLAYFLQLALMLLMFVSPIGFKPEQVPERFQWVIYWNPVTYLIEVYRCSLVYHRRPTLLEFGPYLLMCLGAFVLGSAFFLRFKDAVNEHV
jgi:homopolymeric O-antigen transport system permease protein